MDTHDPLKSLGLASLAAGAGGAAYVAYQQLKDITPPKIFSEKKYHAVEGYADIKKLSTTLYQDLKAVGLHRSRTQIRHAIEAVLNAGEPLDDKRLDVSYKEQMFRPMGD